MIDIVRADLALIQDRGRFGFQEWGVPTSGAWDQEQYQRISLLLGDPVPTVIEVLAGNFTFTTDSAINLALSGQLTTSHGRTDHVMPVAAGTTVTIEVRSISYIGISGLQADRVLDSSATDTVSRLGPGRISAGDRFGTSSTQELRRVLRTPLSSRTSLRFVSGPHGELVQREVEVAAVSRSGIRLTPGASGDSLTLASLPIFPGAIQNTGTELIIIGPDGAVTGGYPVVGVVVEADLPQLARLNVGQKITLQPTQIGQVAISPRPVVVDLNAL